MTKYAELTRYLETLDGDAFMTNFGALEELLGFELPPSAREHRAWWANQGRGQSLAWQSAGWETADVSLDIQTVNFVRRSGSPDGAKVSKLTIAQAKAGLAASLGVPEEAIEITIRA